MKNEQYLSKLQTPEEAVKAVKSGDTVFIGISSSIAYGLCDALGERAEELENVTLTCSGLHRATSVASGANPKAFRVCSYFMGANERRMNDLGLGDFTSVHLSQISLFCEKTARPDVAFFEVTEPDENGYMSYGPSGVSINAHIKDVAKTIILQVNRYTPYVFGEHNRIHVSEADIIVEIDRELVETPDLPGDESIGKISDFLLDQIPDGACIQLGLGGVANAVGYGLRNRNDLGVHTEVMSNSIMDLMKRGVITNARKNFVRGKTVSAFSVGSKELFEFLDHNEKMHYLPFSIVNDPCVIAQNDSMISINTALSIDLFGQVNAENIAGRQFSGTGGQVDFVRGAQMSRGGKSFIAVTSTYNDKKKGMSSRIVSRFPAGTAVTTLRSDVQYVVTEFGCVNLKILTMRDRVQAMISLAHPAFREQLTEEAKASGLL